jgi:hypothetical protein
MGHGRQLVCVCMILGVVVAACSVAPNPSGCVTLSAESVQHGGVDDESVAPGCNDVASTPSAAEGARELDAGGDAPAIAAKGRGGQLETEPQTDCVAAAAAVGEGVSEDARNSVCGGIRDSPLSAPERAALALAAYSADRTAMGDTAPLDPDKDPTKLSKAEIQEAREESKRRLAARANQRMDAEVEPRKGASPLENRLIAKWNQRTDAAEDADVSGSPYDEVPTTRQGTGAMTPASIAEANRVKENVRRHVEAGAKIAQRELRAVEAKGSDVADQVFAVAGEGGVVGNAVARAEAEGRVLEVAGAPESEDPAVQERQAQTGADNAYHAQVYGDLQAQEMSLWPRMYGATPDQVAQAEALLDFSPEQAEEFKELHRALREEHGDDLTPGVRAEFVADMMRKIMAGQPELPPGDDSAVRQILQNGLTEYADSPIVEEVVQERYRDVFKAARQEARQGHFVRRLARYIGDVRDNFIFRITGWKSFDLSGD